MKFNQKTVVFGLGAMGSALVRGWISSRIINPSKITAIDVDKKKLMKGAAQLRIKAGFDHQKSLKDSKLILLAVKPQQMKDLFALAGTQFPAEAIVVSIAAGVSTEQIEKALPQGCPVIRVMPNTPALLGAGMAAISGGKRANRHHVKIALELFSAVGKAVQVPESQMDLVTAISGSGPAYFFHMIEVMAQAGVQSGLSQETAVLLAAQTAYGSALMAIESGKSPEELRIQVTSPGGTTQAALTVFHEKGFKGIIQAAIKSATERGAELRRMNG